MISKCSKCNNDVSNLTVDGETSPFCIKHWLEWYYEDCINNGVLTIEELHRELQGNDIEGSQRRLDEKISYRENEEYSVNNPILRLISKYILVIILVLIIVSVLLFAMR